MNFTDLPQSTAPNAIETISGLYFDVASPDPDMVRIDDIAWATSRLARFAGHTMSEEIWSIAQHAIFVEYLIDLVLSDDGEQLKGSLNAWLHNKGMMSSGLSYLNGDMSLHALLHDAPEAYLVDMPTPVKRHPAIKEAYLELERGVEKAIQLAVGLSPMLPLEREVLRWGDALALKIEAVHLMPSRGRGWSIEFPQCTHMDLYLMPPVKPWRTVCKEFIERYDEIQTQRTFNEFRKSGD
jgi:hypothetical protein